MSSALPVWKVVTAEVRVHLNPGDVGARASTGRAVASREAFSSLLMRYSPELGGVVVSHGSLDFGKEPVFAELVGTSPFARVRAKAELLLFAPSKDAILTGVVTYVGPDHVALSVLSTFHTIIALESTPPGYVFSIDKSTFERSWRNEGYPTIQVGTALRLAVESLRASKNGLFHIQGRLIGGAGEGLGVLEDPEDILVAGGMDAAKEEGEGEGPELEVGRFMRGRTVDVDERRNASEFGGANGVLGSFDDPLIGTVGIEESEEAKKNKKKKRKREKKKRKEAGKRENKGKEDSTGEKQGKKNGKKRKKKEKKESRDESKRKECEGVITEVLVDEQVGTEDREVKAELCDETHRKLSRKAKTKTEEKEDREEARRLSNAMKKARRLDILEEGVWRESFSTAERAPGDKSWTRRAIKLEPKAENRMIEGPGKRKREKTDPESKKKRRKKIKQEIMEDEYVENGTKELIMTAKTELG